MKVIGIKAKLLDTFDGVARAVMDGEPFNYDSYGLPKNFEGIFMEFLVNKDYYKEAFDVDPAEELNKIQVPICIIHGTADENVPTDDAWVLSKAVSHNKMEIHILEDITHMLNKSSYKNSQTDSPAEKIEVDRELLSIVNRFIKKY